MVAVAFEKVKAEEFEAIGLKPGDRPSALCLSGGGIRSATFCLGVMQALARLGLMDKFNYLSTVSGGGYIGGWYSAWRQNQGDAAAAKGLENAVAGPVVWLRRYSNYMSPKLGLFSADAWTLVATYLRNLLLHWLMLAPWLVAAVLVPWLFLSLLKPSAGQYAETGLWVCFALGAYAMACTPRWLPGLGRQVKSERRFVIEHIVPMVAGAAILAQSWFHLSKTWKFADHPEALRLFAIAGLAVNLLGWTAGALAARTIRKFRIPHWLCIVIFGPAEGAAVYLLARSSVVGTMMDEPRLYALFATPLLFVVLMLGSFLGVGLGSFREWIRDPDHEWWARACAWLLIVQVGWLAFGAVVYYGPVLLVYLSGKVHVFWVAAGGTLPGFLSALAAWSSKTFFKKGEDSNLPWKEKIWPWLLTNGAEKVLAPVFLFALFSGLSLGLSREWMKNFPKLEGLPEPVWLLLMVGLACLFGVLLEKIISVNRFSMNAMYRNRLIRAYLGASRDRTGADPLTSFDESDNLDMSRLPARPSGPLHVLNLTLNITGGGAKGENLQWQERQARSFTVTPLYSGWGDKQQPSKDYRKGITLGMAVAVSGAAVSPNCGYHSSRLLTLILSIFNGRLGAWFPNTTLDDPTKLNSISPSSSLVLLKETLGMANDAADWIYLSDGGHFENMGLYEMARRHARLTVACDCGAEAKYKFEDLSNAMQKVRADFGYQIGFLKLPELHNKLDREGKHCAMLEIDYEPTKPDGMKGLILLIKPAFSGQETLLSRDVRKYAEDHTDFPQQTTVDQFFDESQFESYRRLGEQSVEVMAHGFKRGGALHDFFEHVWKEHLKMRAQLPVV